LARPGECHRSGSRSSDEAYLTIAAYLTAPHLVLAFEQTVSEIPRASARS
jgi:hypothetical protein